MRDLLVVPEFHSLLPVTGPPRISSLLNSCAMGGGGVACRAVGMRGGYSLRYPPHDLSPHSVPHCGFQESVFHALWVEVSDTSYTLDHCEATALRATHARNRCK